MKNESEKLGKFKNAVFAIAQKEVDEIISEANRKSEEYLKNVKSENEIFVANGKNEIDKEEKNDAVKKASAYDIDAKRSLLRHREEIVDKVFEQVRQRLDEFVKTDDYVGLMTSKAKKCAEENKGLKGKILIGRSDSKLFKGLSETGNYDVQISDGIVSGGIMIVFDDINVVYDYTVSSALETQRQTFIAKAGLSL